MGKPKNRGGRPRTKRIKAGEKVQIGVRVSPRIRKELEEVAAESGRSLSQEAEFIIERSFERRFALRDTLELAYGRHLAGLIQAIGDTAARTAAGTQALLYLRDHKSGATKAAPFDRVLSDPWIFDQVARATAKIIEHLRPEGEVGPPGDFADNEYALNAGETWADEVIELMEDPGEDRIQWAVENLADLLSKRKGKA